MTLSHYHIQKDELSSVGYLHHPSYFEICEKVREESLSRFGSSFDELKDLDIALVVSKIEANYLKPLTGGPIQIKTSLLEQTSISFSLMHEFFKDDALAFRATLHFVGIRYSTGKATPLPPGVLKYLYQIGSAK